MKCNFCGNKTKVVDTRNKNSTKAKVFISRRIKFIKRDDDIEFRWRERFCSHCNNTSYSIECYLEDIESKIKESKEGKDGKKKL